MKNFLLILTSMLISTTLLFSQEARRWQHVVVDDSDARVQLLMKAGIIEKDSNGSNSGWILDSDYQRYPASFFLEVIESEARISQPLSFNQTDSLGQVIATYPLPPQVDAAIGLGYDGEYFYLSDFSINNEVIYKLDPENNFQVKKTFPAPFLTSPYCWGVTYDGNYLYIANPLEDRIFRTDTSGTVLWNFPNYGALPSGLGYRDGILWNADLGDIFAFPQIPPKIIRIDTTGIYKGDYTLSNTTNGVTANDASIFISRNNANGKIIMAMDPVNFTLQYSFPSPLDYPNGLAFDGQYLWVAGKDGGTNYIVQMDLDIQPPPPPSLTWEDFTLVADGQFNNRFNTAFDSEGNIHIAYATQFETASETKEIMYATNKSGVWELSHITNDQMIDELPEILVDSNDVAHVIWNGYQPTEGDIEIWYSNNASGTFSPKIQITSKAQDGIDNHTWPHFVMDENNLIHFTFLSSPQSGVGEVYYATYDGVNTTSPVNISNNSVGDYDPKIILDQQGNPHIFWCYWGSRLYHATNTTGSWAPEEITEMGWTRPAIALDSQGFLHFAVVKSENVKYGNNISGSFVVTDTLATHMGSCFYPEMASDLSDVLHLTYHSFGDSLTTWPGSGEIFYTNSNLWSQGKFPVNISQLPSESELYPGIAVYNDTTIVVGWAKTGFTEGVFSDLRLATTLPDSGGILAGKVNATADSNHFGYIAPLDTAYWSFSVYNSGTRDLAISDIYWTSLVGPAFIVETEFGGAGILGPGDSLLVNVMATVDVPVRVPADTILYEGYLVINSDDPLLPEKLIQLSAETEVVGIGDRDDPVILTNRLYSNYPNPFNPETTIRYDLKEKSRVTLEIFNVNGQLVRTLAAAEQGAGEHRLVWDGRNDAGNILATGVYVYRLKINDQYLPGRKMMFVK